MLEFGASPQVHFGNTDNFAVLPMELQVQGLKFIRHIEVCFLLDFLVGHESLRFFLQSVDELIHHFLVQLSGNIDVFPSVKGTNKLVTP